MTTPEVHFTDPRLDGMFGHELGQLPQKFNTLANDLARQRFGKTALINPSNIHLTPLFFDDEYSVIVGMEHETSGPNPGLLQRHDTTFRLGIDGENIALVTEDKRGVLMTAREAVLMHEVARTSIAAATANPQNPLQ